MFRESCPMFDVFRLVSADVSAVVAVVFVVVAVVAVFIVH